MAEIVEIARYSAGSRASVVFVHGISGHAYETWRRAPADAEPDAAFWPLWLAEDFQGSCVLTLAYEAPTSRWVGTSMPLEDWANNVAESLLAHAQLRSGPIVFICHSLGGLIIKRAFLTLREQKDQRTEAADFLGRVRLVVFAATPHTGSRQATLIGRLAFLTWPTPLATVLFSNSPTLRQINISYRTFAKDYQNSLSHRVFFETLDTTIFRIVTEEAADPGLNTNPFGVPANHIDIVKPKDRNADIYQQILLSLRKIGKDNHNYGEIIYSKLPKIGRNKSPYFWPRFIRIAISLAVAVAIVIMGFSIWRPRDARASVIRADEQAIRILVQNNTSRSISTGSFRFEVGFPGEARIYSYNLGFPEVTIQQGESKLLNAQTIDDTQAKYITPILEARYYSYWEEFQRSQSWAEGEVPTLEKLYRVFRTMSCRVIGELVASDGTRLTVEDNKSCADYQQFLRMNALQILRINRGRP